MPHPLVPLLSSYLRGHLQFKLGPAISIWTLRNLPFGASSLPDLGFPGPLNYRFRAIQAGSVTECGLSKSSFK